MIINRKYIGFLLLSCSLSSCSSFLPKSGPSSTAVRNITRHAPEVTLINLTPSVVKHVRHGESRALFAATFNPHYKRQWGVQPGDALEVYIWESYPQLLFGSNSIPGVTSPSATTKNTALPEQTVDVQGYISIPYIGKIEVAGKTLRQIEQKITASLKGKANYPQVIVKLAQNISATVTVVGDVKQSRLVPLTPKKERVLDAIAEAGGVSAPINKVTIQMTRAGMTQSMSLEHIIKNPLQNILLQPADVLTAYYQSLSFTVLGAAGKNTEVNFEAQGISLAQALGRMEGLKDDQANASALFIFRFEDRENIPTNHQKKWATQFKIPVVYRVNLNDPGTFFMAQNFPIRDKDVIYVSNAPGTELYKFLRMIGAGLYPIGMASALYNVT